MTSNADKTLSHVRKQNATFVFCLFVFIRLITGWGGVNKQKKSETII